MPLLMIAGIAALLAGAAAIWVGIPVKEFSFGNTMILAGAVGLCSGLLLIGLGLVVRELKAIRRHLQDAAFEPRSRDDMDGPLLPAGSLAGRSGGDSDRLGTRRIAPGPGDAQPTAVARREDETTTPRPVVESADRSGPGEAGPDVVAAPVPPAKRRNLLFSSSRRSEALAGTGSAARPGPDASPKAAAEPHPSFSGTWPRNERASRGGDVTARREPVTPPTPPAPAATVVKSGVVDGMAYSLYSDGSIEAQMPEGMMRFASIEQLRAHLDRTA
ncbi:MAG TPA: DUF308 domain-containing protein [Xanthobacteraceae bacterium]|nr:DUF308 domain-containing protein [Xanthobacteraceae bacterium]